MRRVLFVVGVAVLAIAAVAAIGVGVAAYRGPTFDEEAKAFLNEAAQAILANRDKRELLDRATPELRANAKPQQIAAIFDALSRLGPLVEYEGVTGDATMDPLICEGVHNLSGRQRQGALPARQRDPSHRRRSPRRALDDR
jgi:hypothetical protein